MTKDKERDDALIADRLWNLADCTEDPAAQKLMLEAVHALRGDEQPKPDRAVYWAREVMATYRKGSADGYRMGKYDGDYSIQKTVPILQAAFDELRAEWEAERPAVVVPEEQIKQMVTRFLCWKLPEDFHPDDGISFEPFFNVEWNAKQGKPPQRRTPTGTNLFTSTQAEAMVRYIIDGAKGDE